MIRLPESRHCSSDPSIFKCALNLSLGSSQAEGLILVFALVQETIPQLVGRCSRSTSKLGAPPPVTVANEGE